MQPLSIALLSVVEGEDLVVIRFICLASTFLFSEVSRRLEIRGQPKQPHYWLRLKCLIVHSVHTPMGACYQWLPGHPNLCPASPKVQNLSKLLALSSNISQMHEVTDKVRSCILNREWEWHGGCGNLTIYPRANTCLEGPHCVVQLFKRLSHNLVLDSWQQHMRAHMCMNAHSFAGETDGW